MKVWITCFILLFASAELLQWFRQFSFPLPIFILGGVFLAVASNYDKLTYLPFHPDHPETEEMKEIPPSPATKTPISVGSRSTSSASISFEIRKPFQPRD